ncbi:MAG TPA: rhomboid family intramembrane serine protease [Pyrinomonadaceae bacterium]|nr:rhomboid family intramembrane serine protease [Pyrinomonadaceae bacterium]
MVFPLYDDNTGRTTTPFVTYALIALNVLVFVFLQGLGSNEPFTYAFSTVPQEILTGVDIAKPIVIRDPLGGDAVRINHEAVPISVYLTLLTSMFMHGGFAHILGNMLFLWIFGDNVEDDLGHLRFLAFYLLTGLVASLAHVFTTAAFGGNPYIPSLGASGAISGVLGGYLVLHPRRRVTVILLRMLTDVPAYVAVGLWFVFQLINGLGLLGGGSQTGGVAYAAHIGGFIAGLALVKIFALGRGARATSNAPRGGFGRP